MKKYILACILLLVLSQSKAQSIVMDTFSRGFCTGQPLLIHFSTALISTNDYILAEISDNSGVYHGTYIGSADPISWYYISCTIPNLSGSGYRIRMYDSTVHVYSNDNGTNLTIASAPQGVLTVSGNPCQSGDTLTLAAGDPYGVTWYQDGNAISTSQRVYTVAGGHGYGHAADQVYPWGTMYVSRAGDIYISDAATGYVKKFPAGSTSSTPGIIVAKQGDIVGVGVFVDAAGYLYVGDGNYNTVRKYPPNSDSTTPGVIVAGWPNPQGMGGSGLNQFDQPWALYVDSSGSLYVSDLNNTRVLKFPAGSDSSTLGTIVASHGINAGGAISVDASGNLYVADYLAGVLKYPAGSNANTVPTVVAAQNVSQAIGLFVDSIGNIYVADSDRVQMFPAGSNANTIGTIVAGGHGYGPAISQFNLAFSVSVDAAGSIYIADQGNFCVQKWIPGAPDTIYVPATTGMYTATYMSALGCASQISDTVGIYPPLSPTPAISQHGADTLSTGAYASYQWLDNGSPISNGNTETIVATQNGSYRVVVTDANGCIDTSAALSIVSTAVSKVTYPGNANLYPNPNNGSFILESIMSHGHEYVIYDVVGKVVSQGNIDSDNQDIEIGNISAGTYILEIKGSQNKNIRFTVNP